VVGRRLPGLAAAVGGVLYFVAGLRFTADHTAYDRVTAILSVLWVIGSLVGVVGMVRLGVAGRGGLGRVAAAVAFAGLGVVLLAWLIGFDDPAAAEDGALMAVGRVLTLIGFLCLGIATVRTRRWSGWRRLAPFFYLLAVLLGALSWAVAGVELTVALIGLAWVGIGAAVATDGPDDDGRPARA
jgi:hypothetical protein